jgi:hypothetical protein
LVTLTVTSYSPPADTEIVVVPGGGTPQGPVTLKVFGGEVGDTVATAVLLLVALYGPE